MLCHSRPTLILVICAIVTAGLVPLAVTGTSTWAQDSDTHKENANHTRDTRVDGHTHGEHVEHTHGTEDDSHSHDKQGGHSHNAEDGGHSHSVTHDHTHGTVDDGHFHVDDSSHSHDEDDSVKLSDKAKANIGLKTAETDVRAIERGVQVTGNVIPHPSGADSCHATNRWYRQAHPFQPWRLPQRG